MVFGDIFEKTWQATRDKLTKKVTKGRTLEIINGNIRFASSVLPMLDDIILYTQQDNPIRQAILRVPELKYVVEEMEYIAKRDRHAGFGYVKQSVLNAVAVLPKLQRVVETEFAKNEAMTPEEASYRLRHVTVFLGTMRTWFRYINLLASMVRVTAIDYTHPDIHLNVKTVFGEGKLKKVKDNFNLMLSMTTTFHRDPDDIFKEIEHIPVIKEMKHASLYVPKQQLKDGIRLADLSSLFDANWVKIFFNPMGHVHERNEMTILEKLDEQADVERNLILEGALPDADNKEAKIARARLLGRINNFRTTIEKLEDAITPLD